MCGSYWQPIEPANSARTTPGPMSRNVVQELILSGALEETMILRPQHLSRGKQTLELGALPTTNNPLKQHRF